MRSRYIKICILLLCLPSTVLMASNFAVLANYERSYSFQMQYGILGQKLYVSVQPSLYRYYNNMNHVVYSDFDYQHFVTPETVRPIAEAIHGATKNLPNNNEQFADAVLTFVHQIPYVVSGIKYPVETIVNNSGDCVGLSILAASIMKAGGLDVVLVRYEGIEPGHVNIGVYLPYTPAYHTLLMTPSGLSYDNKTYWTAEATAKTDWKVGDQSESLANAQAIIIPLDSCEKMSPGEVSSSLDNSLLNSSLSINLSQVSSMVEQDMRCLLISGSIQA